MGGAAPTISGKGGKKALDAAINLVPFIDLLACCISFLIVTATWAQLARMNVTQKNEALNAPVNPDDTPKVKLILFIDKGGYTFTKSTGESTQIPMKQNEYDYSKLADILKETKVALPDRSDLSLKASDGVLYEKIIRTMDVAVSNQFADIALSDKGGGT